MTVKASSPGASLGSALLAVRVVTGSNIGIGRTYSSGSNSFPYESFTAEQNGSLVYGACSPHVTLPQRRDLASVRRLLCGDDRAGAERRLRDHAVVHDGRRLQGRRVDQRPDPRPIAAERHSLLHRYLAGLVRDHQHLACRGRVHPGDGAGADNSDTDWPSVPLTTASFSPPGGSGPSRDRRRGNR
jgi:hypothetical protein